MSATWPDPGWYPDSNEPHIIQRYWNGGEWTQHTAPTPAPTVTGGDLRNAFTFGAIALTGIGVVLNNQSVSLLTGTGIIWVGVALCIAAMVGCFVFTRFCRTWVMWVCIVAAVLTAAQATWVEYQLEQRRQEIQNVLNQP